jgi:hypothetical protein
VRYFYRQNNFVVLAVFLLATSVQAQNVPQASQASPTSAIAPTVTMPATTRTQAQEQAKVDSGRSDPLAPVTGFKHFPSHDASFVPPDKMSPTGKATIIKKDASNSSKGTLSDTNPYLKIPPPPATPSMPGSLNELPVSDLPAPPERPCLVNSITLTGIVGNKAIFSVTDLSARLKNNWPKALLLGVGDHFESISVISLDADRAVLEENGERTDKRLERIR